MAWLLLPSATVVLRGPASLTLLLVFLGCQEPQEAPGSGTHVNLPPERLPRIVKRSPGSDEPRLWYRDADGDGYTRTGETLRSVEDPDGPGLEWVALQTAADCDDDPEACGAACQPGRAADICDGWDNDCDGSMDEDPDLRFYADRDGDGAGDPAIYVDGCERPEGYVQDGADCDDDPNACGAGCHPGAVEAIGASTCEDGWDNDCNGVVDAAAPSCDASGAPRTAFDVTPGAAAPGTPIVFDAGARQDETDTSLVYRWDFDDDGVFDMENQGQAMAVWTFSEPGVHPVTLVVEAPSGTRGQFMGHVVIALEEQLLVVTSTADHVTPNDGELTLREAMLRADAIAGPNTISFDSALTITLSDQLPTLSEPDTAIVGRPGVVIVGSPAAGDYCLGSSASRTAILWLSIRGCPEDGIELQGGESWVAHVRSWGHGDDGVDFTGASNRLGPDVEAWGNDDAGFEVEGDLAVIEGSRAFDNTRGLKLPGGNPASGALILMNVFAFNQTGVAVAPAVDDLAVWHTTFHGNAQVALLFLAPDTAAGETAGSLHDVRNNVITGNGTGIRTSGGFAALGSNAFFQNSNGDCDGCREPMNALRSDPAFVDPTGDFRLLPGSPCVDAGEDLGIDVNGRRSGMFEGAAPDLGAKEQL